MSIVDCFSEHKANWKKHCFHSEDSSTLNTSFVERHNLNHPAGLLLSWPSARLATPRRTELLEGHVALLMAYYNFVRPHSALRFGKNDGGLLPGRAAWPKTGSHSERSSQVGRHSFCLF